MNGAWIATCGHCGELRTGTFGTVATEAAIHRSATYPDSHSVEVREVTERDVAEAMADIGNTIDFHEDGTAR